MLEAASGPAGGALVALGALALAVLACALAWNEWQRRRERGYLYAALGLGVVAFQQAAAVAAGTLFLAGYPLARTPAPLAVGLDSLAAIALAFGLGYSAIRPWRYHRAALFWCVVAVVGLVSWGYVSWSRYPLQALPFQQHPSHTALHILGTVILAAGAVLVSGSALPYGPTTGVGLGLLALAFGFRGQFSFVPYSPSFLSWAASAAPVLQLPGLALLVYGVYAHVRYDWQESAFQRLNLMRQLADNHASTVAGTVAAGIAHEMNGPLTALAARAQMALSATEEDRRRGHLEALSDDIWRLAGLTRSLLDFSRPRTHEPETVNVGELLEEVSELLAFEARRARSEVTLEPGAGSQRVLAQRFALEHAVLDLARRGLHCRESGARVVLQATRRDEEVVIAIRDNGPELSEAELSALLDWSIGGTAGATEEAVALYVCQEALEAMGGRLTATSGAQGSTFFLHLPAGTAGGINGRD